MQIGLCSLTHYLDSVALLHCSHVALNSPSDILMLLAIAVSPHELFFTATTPPPQSKTCHLCFVTSRHVLLFAAGNTELFETSHIVAPERVPISCCWCYQTVHKLSYCHTRQTATSQHVFCPAAIVPPQSNINHIAASECVLVSCSWYDQTLQDMTVVTSQHVLFVGAGPTRLSKT